MMDMERTKLSLILKNKMSLNQKKFLAEVIGTFIVVVLATGSVVVDAKMGGSLGLPFIAFAPFVGVVVGVYLFGRISMAHFNPAVTLGFLITKHISKRMFFLYVVAEVTGALLASLFVSSVIGAECKPGCQLAKLLLPFALGVRCGGAGFGPADGCHIGGCAQKRLEGFWRDGSWGNGGP